VIGVSATGLLSLIVMSLAELLGDSFSVVLGIASEVGKIGRQNSNVVTSSDRLAAGRQTAIDNRRASKRRAMSQIVGILQEQPDISKAELADRVGKARSTVSNYLAELQESGAINHNGRG
jgi:predicted HTH transcriptional regulator